MGCNGWILVHIRAVVMDEFYVHIWVVINLLCMVKYFISMSTWFVTKWSLFLTKWLSCTNKKTDTWLNQKITHGPTKMSRATSPASMDDGHVVPVHGTPLQLTMWTLPCDTIHITCKHGPVHIIGHVAPPTWFCPCHLWHGRGTVISAAGVADTTWTKLDNLWWKWWRFSFYHRGEMDVWQKFFRRG